MAENRMKVLVLSTFDGTSANVIGDFLFSFRLHSRHKYYYIFDCRMLDGGTDFNSFDVILMFWSLYLLGPDLSEEVRERIRAAEACKVLFLQDEYRDVRRFNRVMTELGVNVMFTCVAEKDHDIFYPQKLIPSLQATYTVLTGYVPRYLDGIRPDLVSQRGLDIAYRSRELPFYLGDLGREKKIVADRFEVVSAAHGFRSDISVRERDRLYGSRWVDFLRSSRCVLGSPSGASVIDFTGEIRQNCERYLAFHPEATYEEVKARFFADVDWKVVIDTVSPRIFEATALRCTLVQHEGRYAGILDPDEHYICVKRDYSNIGQVIDRIKDAAFCRRLAERAYADLIASGRYTYGTFVERFESLLARHVPSIRGSSSLSLVGFYARNCLRHDQAIVPYRDRFLVLPSRRGFCKLVGRALAKLGGRRYGRVLSRLSESPAGVLTRMSLAVKTTWGSAALRAIWYQYWRFRHAYRDLRLDEVMNDFVKIDIVRHARAGSLRSRQSFRISATYDQSSGVVTLKSSSRGQGERLESTDGADMATSCDQLPSDVTCALLEGKVSMVIWDHSALSQEIVYCPNKRTRRPRWVTMGLAAGGVYRFEALTCLCQRAPAVVGPAVLALLRGEREAPTPPTIQPKGG